MLADAQALDPHRGAELEMSENRDHGEEHSPLTQLRIVQAVTNQKVEQLVNAINDLRGEVRELKSNFATKSELNALEEEIKGIKGNLSWVIKIIVGAVVTAVLGLVLVKGGISQP